MSAIRVVIIALAYNTIVLTNILVLVCTLYELYLFVRKISIFIYFGSRDQDYNY